MEGACGGGWRRAKLGLKGEVRDLGFAAGFCDYCGGEVLAFSGVEDANEGGGAVDDGAVGGVGGGEDEDGGGEGGREVDAWEEVVGREGGAEGEQESERQQPQRVDHEHVRSYCI